MQRFVLAALLFWMSGAKVAEGGISAPSSHAHLSGDGKRVLVMISPVMKYDRQHPVSFTLPDGRSIILHETFGKTGCYDAATLAPFWQADWYLPDGNLDWLASRDFTHVVIVNRFGLSKDPALIFCHEGRFGRQYDCKQLLTGYRHHRFLPFRTWDWHYGWHDEFELDGDEVLLSTQRRALRYGNYELTLGLQEFYTFDINTGEMLTQTIAGAWVVPMYALLLVSACITLAWIFWRRVRSKPHAG